MGDGVAGILSSLTKSLGEWMGALLLKREERENAGGVVHSLSSGGILGIGLL